VQEIPVTCVDTFAASGPNVTECRSTGAQFTLPITDLKWGAKPQGGAPALPGVVVQGEPEVVEQLGTKEEPNAIEEPKATKTTEVVEDEVLS
jgi:hypothetical protein